jgi:hypothetical protein
VKKPNIAAGIGCGARGETARAVAEAVDAMIRSGVRLDSKKARDRVHAAVREKRRRRERTKAEGAAEVRGEALRELATGAKQHRRQNKGGRPTAAQRDEEMALEFLKFARQYAGYTDTSATAAKYRIGSEYGLSPSASVAAIARGIKALSQIPPKKHR